MVFLSSAESSNRFILDNMLDAVICISASGAITYTNQTALHLFGYKAGDLHGQNIKCLMVDYHARQHDQYLQDYSSNHVKRVIGKNRVLQAKHANGELMPIELRVCEMAMADGTAYLGVIRDMRESLAKREQILRLENNDLLTGLPNRQLLMQQLTSALDNLVLAKQSYVLLMLDADDFSKINQGFGFEYGDEVLRHIAAKLGGYAEFDLVARASEDEFAVLMQTALAGNELRNFVLSVLRHLAQPVQVFEASISCGFSAGLFAFSTPDFNPQVIIGRAEAALLHAKQQQRGSVVMYCEAIDSEQRTSALLDQALKAPDITSQLFLAYQAQVDSSGRPNGFEALMRWRYHDELIPPDVFIALAERNGAIYPIGSWLLEQACAFLRWSATIPALAHCSLSINISPKQFAHPGFVADVIQTLDNYQICPSRLHLELTERLLLENPAIVIEKMQDLRAYGISFSLDDFGTGYSSLAYLKNLPLSELKIDKSFIDEIETDASDKKIVATIILLAQGLGLSVVAEGVETAGQLAQLQLMGCNRFQGYFFAKPIPQQQLLAQLPQ